MRSPPSACGRRVDGRLDLILVAHVALDERDAELGGERLALLRVDVGDDDVRRRPRAACGRWPRRGPTRRPRRGRPLLRSSSVSLLGWWGGGSYAAGPPGASAAVAPGGPVWYHWGMKRLGGAAALVLAFVFTSTAGAVTPDYYPLPTGYLIAGGISADDHGNVWFGSHKPGPESASDAVSPVAHLGRLDTSQAIANTNGGFSFYPTPNPLGQNCCATSIRSWPTAPAEQRIYFIRSDGVYGYGVPASMVNGQPTGITDFRLERIIDLGDIAVSPAQDGGVWFTERSTSNVAIPSGPNAGQFPGAPDRTIRRLARRRAEHRHPVRPDGDPVAPVRRQARRRRRRQERHPLVRRVGSRQPRLPDRALHPGRRPLRRVVAPVRVGSPCSGSFTGTGRAT